MRPLDGIEVVTFDAAGTLFFPLPSVGAIYAEVFSQFGLELEPTRIEASFKRAFRDIQPSSEPTKGQEPARSYWRSIVYQTLHTLTPIPENFGLLFDALWLEFAKGSRWRLNEDATFLLNELEHLGIRCALLTNWDSRVRSVTRDHGLEQEFSKTFISSEIGFEKPNERLFQFAAEALETRPERILHVGDSYRQDFLGATKAGWKASLLDPNQSSFLPRPLSISRLSELAKAL